MEKTLEPLGVTGGFFDKFYAPMRAGVHEGPDNGICPPDDHQRNARHRSRAEVERLKYLRLASDEFPYARKEFLLFGIEDFLAAVNPIVDDVRRRKLILMNPTTVVKRNIIHRGLLHLRDLTQKYQIKYRISDN
jgi:hypothetical protein